VHRNRWRRGADLACIFTAPADEEWTADRDLVDGVPADPFTRRESCSITSVMLSADPDLGDVDAAISPITLAELHFGVLVAGDPTVRAEGLRRLGLIARTFDPIPVDEVVARKYGRLAASTTSGEAKPAAVHAGDSALSVCCCGPGWTRLAS
jgi:hypothetical protein